MIPNPYESPRATEPATAPREREWFRDLRPIELCIAGAQLLLLLGAAAYRWQLVARTAPVLATGDSLESVFIGCGIGLPIFAGIRGLIYVLTRNQRRAVISGLLCVSGFCAFIGAGLLYFGP